LKFGVKYIQRSNHAYLDQNLQVQQLSNFNYFQFQIATIFNAGNFYFSNVSYLQYSDASAIIRLPLLHTYESIYFQRHLFKKALFLRTGFDVRYYTSMEAYRYDPANAEFFLGNTTIGDFPIFDYFVTLSLKRAVLLLKVEHLNQGVGRLGNNMVTGYPLLDRSVKIGFKWAFYD